MTGRFLPISAIFFSTLLVVGCRLHGAPRAGTEIQRPEAVHDFATLYQQNCSACHGAQGQYGPAIDLANPVYQALVDDESMRSVIVNGYPGTLMPAFGQSAGGMLTAEQVTVLVDGMRAQWRKPGTLDGQNAPAYHAAGSGDATHGQQVYATHCASCHGNGEPRGIKVGSILDASYLSLVSDQALRTLAITNRPDLGAPDWRSYVPGRPMTDQEVTDVVAWIASHRSTTPGQPYPQHP